MTVGDIRGCPAPCRIRKMTGDGAIAGGWFQFRETAGSYLGTAAASVQGRAWGAGVNDPDGPSLADGKRLASRLALGVPQPWM